MPDCLWKPNWKETQQHFNDWWARKGLVAIISSPLLPSRIDMPSPPEPVDPEDSFIGKLRPAREHAKVACRPFLGDAMPMVAPNFGPGSLALMLGSEPLFTWNTLWFLPAFTDLGEPENWPALRFDPENRWWKETEEILSRCRELAADNYIVGFPDLVENMDILASLRDMQPLLMDMIERPEWVLEKLEEIFVAWKEAYERCYQIIKLSDGSSAWGAFHIWGPGRIAKVQCDMSAAFGPDMFKKFVVPTLERQCDWLDHSLYHLDGTQCICHLDHLLAIESLDVVQWTPQAGIERPGDPRWYDLYKKVLAGGKSLQVNPVTVPEAERLLDTIGGKGVYLAISAPDEKAVEAALTLVEKFR